jgi:nitrogen fixation NifU-like protein
VSSGVRDLYRDIVIEHSKRPRNFRKLESAHAAEGYNPLCGDRVTVCVDFAGERLNGVTFEGSGCAVCIGSASMMTEILKGMSREEAAQIFDSFRVLVTSGPEASSPARLGELGAFAGVRAFPSRIKCALLPWETLWSALNGSTGTISTE